MILCALLLKNRGHGQGLLFWLSNGDIDRAPLKEVEVDVDIDRSVGC